MELQMTDLAVTDALFFERTGMDPGRIEALVDQSLAGMDDGELYLEYSQSESLALDDGRIKSASFDTTQGGGDPPRGRYCPSGGERSFRGLRGAPSRDKPEPLHRAEPAWPRRSRGKDAAPCGN
jgi:hypothetical protein